MGQGIAMIAVQICPSIFRQKENAHRLVCYLLLAYSLDIACRSRYCPDLLPFCLRQNVRCRIRPAGFKQLSTGQLHLIVQICPVLFLQKEKAHHLVCFSFWRYWPDLNWRITVLQTGALPLGYGTIWKSGTRGYVPDLWSGRRGSNSLPPPWQGGALPDELHPQMATPNGLEPSTSSVTGWRANRLHHRARLWWEQQGSNL